jgi:hypothetical protein
MSTINQARLILSEQFHLTKQDMHRDNPDLKRTSDIPLIHIHLLDWILRVPVGNGKAGEVNRLRLNCYRVQS